MVETRSLAVLSLSEHLASLSAWWCCLPCVSPPARGSRRGSSLKPHWVGQITFLCRWMALWWQWVPYGRLKPRKATLGHLNLSQFDWLELGNDILHCWEVSSLVQEALLGVEVFDSTWCVRRGKSGCSHGILMMSSSATQTRHWRPLQTWAVAHHEALGALALILQRLTLDWHA